MELIQFSDIPEIKLRYRLGREIPTNVQQKTINELQRAITEIRSAYRKAEKDHHYGYDCIRELYICQEIIFVVKDKKRKQAAMDRIEEIRQVLLKSGKDADKILNNFWRQSCFLMLDVFELRIDCDK